MEEVEESGAVGVASGEQSKLGKLNVEEDTLLAPTTDASCIIPKSFSEIT